MKTTGIVRTVDMLGHIVLPIGMRRALGIGASDEVDVFTDGESIIIRKHAPACVFCGNPKDNIEYHGKLVCRNCISQM